MREDMMVAYQTVDPENDIWSNVAMLFDTQEDANKFFANPELVLKTLDIELNENTESIYNINYEVTCVQGTDTVNHVTFECEYCGKKNILMMYGGHYIKL